MTGPSGNRLSICPLRFRIASPRVPVDLGGASVSTHYATTFNIYWWTFVAVSILDVYEAALTYMISLNHITFDHICVDL